MVGVGLITCGERNSSDKSRTAQQVVVYELQLREEVEGVRQEVREVEGESKAKRNATMNMNMWMG